MSFIGLDEIMIIVVISLVILGPSKTFQVAFYIGSLFGKAKNYAVMIQKELGLEEQRKSINSVVSDFSGALKDPLVSKVPSHTDKRMWTVQKEDFSNQTQVSSFNENHLSKENDLLKRLNDLEKELASIKAAINEVHKEGRVKNE